MNAELQKIIERIERIEEERRELASDVREIYAEAKGKGFDTKTIREIIKLRKMAPNERSEYEFLRSEYKSQLGIE